MDVDWNFFKKRFGNLPRARKAYEKAELGMLMEGEGTQRWGLSGPGSGREKSNRKIEPWVPDVKGCTTARACVARSPSKPTRSSSENPFKSGYSATRAKLAETGEQSRYYLCRIERLSWGMMMKKWGDFGEFWQRWAIASMHVRVMMNGWMGGRITLMTVEQHPPAVLRKNHLWASRRCQIS